MKLEKIKGRGTEHLYRHSAYNTIYFRRFTNVTGEVTRSLKTTDLAEAKLKRDQLLRGVVRPTKGKKTAMELFDLWIERKVAMGKAPGTITSIRNTRRILEPHLYTMLPDEITADWWESVFIPWARGTHGAKRKFMNDCKWLKSFLKSLHEDGVISKLPRLHNPDPRVSVGKVFSDEEVSSLINFAQNEDLRLAILMAATMGMRRGEIFGLRANRVNILQKTINLKREDTKTRKSRSFSISPSCQLELFQRAEAGSPWVFPSKTDPSKPLHKDGFKTAWSNLKTICSVDGRFHDLRHTFLTKAFSAAGANPALICHYAGLSLEVAERVYLHLTKDDSKKVAALVAYE